MSDTRTVATDALATLGTIIDDTAKRDAIHLAVIPMVAFFRLKPGCPIRIVDGNPVPASRDDPGVVGIVDPFLEEDVHKKQRFWLILLPRTIQSLRHVWSHPAFPDEPVAGERAVTTTDKAAESEKWLRDWCDRNDVPRYETIMDSIRDGEEFIHTGSMEFSGSLTSEFWDHVEIVTGTKQVKRELYFSCSC